MKETMATAPPSASNIAAKAAKYHRERPINKPLPPPQMRSQLRDQAKLDEAFRRATPTPQIPSDSAQYSAALALAKTSGRSGAQFTPSLQQIPTDKPMPQIPTGKPLPTPQMPRDMSYKPSMAKGGMVKDVKMSMGGDMANKSIRK